LSLPFPGRLYLAVVAAEAVADNEMAVNILGTGQAAERGQLLYIAGFGAAAVNFNIVPAAVRLDGFRENGFFYGVKLIVTRQTKWTLGRTVVSHGKQND
jgi:hypothetical protein